MLKPMWSWRRRKTYWTSIGCSGKTLDKDDWNHLTEEEKQGLLKSLEGDQ